VLARSGNRFTVSQSCIDAGSGPAPRSSERQMVTIHDALNFTVARGSAVSRFRYCPVRDLPTDLRAYAR
jgi:hypothetical protein